MIYYGNNKIITGYYGSTPVTHIGWDNRLFEISYPENTVAVYTSNTSDTAVVSKACSASDWKDTAVNNGDGTYTHTITASAMPTRLRFGYIDSYNTQNTKLLTVKYINTSSLTTMDCMFYNCTSLEAVNCYGWDTSQVTNMRAVFNLCWYLTIIIGTNTWDTSNVTDMSNMFYQCPLTTLDLSGWDFTGVHRESTSSGSSEYNHLRYMFDSSNTSLKLYLVGCKNYTKVINTSYSGFNGTYYTSY